MNQWTQDTLDRVYQIDPPFACHAQYALDEIAGQMQNCHTAPTSPYGGAGSCCIHPSPALNPPVYASPFRPPTFQWPFVDYDRPKSSSTPFRWPFARCRKRQSAIASPQQFVSPLPPGQPTAVQWNYPTGVLSWYPLN